MRCGCGCGAHWQCPQLPGHIGYRVYAAAGQARISGQTWLLPGSPPGSPLNPACPARQVLEDHARPVLSLAVADGKLFSGSYDYTIKARGLKP